MTRSTRQAILELGSRYEMVIWFFLVVLSITPLIGTVNDLLTQLALRTGVYHLIETYIAPFFSRFIGTVFSEVFGVETVVDGAHMYLLSGGLPYDVFVVWNCVGWQSFVLLAFTLATVLQGKYTLGSKLKCVLLGLEGVFIINVLRITASGLLLLSVGYGPAIAFHDYASPLLTLLWLLVFWNVSEMFILESPTVVQSESILERVVRTVKETRPLSLLSDFIFGKRVMGVTTMVIIILFTALNGIFILSAGAAPPKDQTIVSFEYEEDPVYVNGIATNRIMTTPEFTQLGSTPHLDVYQGGLWPGYVEMWAFLLHGSLESDYYLQGAVDYEVWMHLKTYPPGKTSYQTYVKFTLYDVDEYGSYSPVHTDTFNLKLTQNPKRFRFKGDDIDEHIFAEGHSIRLGIEVFDGFLLKYALEYDSESRHSNIDLPGMVVPERVLNPYVVVPLVAVTILRRRRK